MVDKKRYRSRSGQSPIEYATVFILVGIGVLVMGPYVIRSWNANLKGWEDTTRDAFQEDLKQAPLSDVGGDPSTCTCDDWVQVNCGADSSGLGGASCANNEMLFTRNCIPLGCGPSFGIATSKCEIDSSCCIVTAEGCGNVGGSGCADTDMTVSLQCGSNPSSRDCEINSPACVNQCANGAPLLDPPWEVELCPNDDINLPAPNIPYTYVPEDGCSQPDGSSPQCEVECKAPFSVLCSGLPCVPPAVPNMCDCGPGQVKSPDGRSCPCDSPRYLNPGVCPAGFIPTNILCTPDGDLMLDVCAESPQNGCATCGGSFSPFADDVLAATLHCKNQGAIGRNINCAVPIQVVKNITGIGGGNPCPSGYQSKGLDPVTNIRYCVEYVDACPDDGTCTQTTRTVIRDIELKLGAPGNNPPPCSGGWTQYLLYDLTNGTRTGPPNIAIRFCKTTAQLCTLN